MAKKLSVSDLRRMIAEEVRRAAILAEFDAPPAPREEFDYGGPDDRGESKKGTAVGYLHEDGSPMVRLEFAEGPSVVMYTTDVEDVCTALVEAAASADDLAGQVSTVSAPMPREY